jgi:Protein of unknown function (DUF3574)
MNRSKIWLVYPAILAAQIAAASAQGLSCNLPQKQMIEIDLLFGRNIGGRLGVTDKRWTSFLAREVTPRFPDGLTVFDAYGQWRDDKRKTIAREPSKIVRIITTDADAQTKIDAVVEAYKRRFRQQSVGVVTRPACVSF